MGRGRLAGVLAGGGVLFLALAIFVFLFVPHLVQKKINEAVVIDSPSSSGYAEWVSSYASGNSEMQTYTFFNLTNEAEVLAGGAPKFDPVGPYAYRRNSVKIDPVFVGDGTAAEFKEQSVYTFVPELSVTDDPSKVQLTNFFPFYQAAVNKAGGETALLYGFVPTLLGMALQEIEAAVGAPGNVTAGLLQWGSLGVTGSNVASLPQLELAAPPTRNISLSLEDAQTLLFGPLGLVSNAEAGPMFFAYLNANEVGEILSKWPLGSPTNVAYFAAYVQHLIAVRGIGFAEQVFFQGGRGTGLIVTHTLEQWLWEYEDPLLAVLEPTLAGLAHLQFNDTSANFTRATKQPSVVATGKGDLSALNSYIQWNGRRSIDVYEPAGPVYGTNGHAFGPDISKRAALNVFVSEIQRPLNVIHVADAKVKGIDVFEYRLNPAELQPSVQYVSPVYGLFNIAPISHGIPLEISKPFFLNADPELARAAGITPNYARDSTYLDVEPMTGIAFRASLKLQINVRINSNLTNVFFPHATSGVWPILAIHRDGLISDKDADNFKKTVRAALIAAKVCFGIGLAFSTVLFAAAIYLLARPACGHGVRSGGYDDLVDGAELPANKSEGSSLLGTSR